MVSSDEKLLLDLTYAEYEGIGTWYEYLVKFKIFRKLKNINTILVAGLPQEYGISADMILLAKTAKLTVIDNRQEKLNQFLEIAKKFNLDSNITTILSEDLTKYQFEDNTFDLVSNTEVIQRVNNPKDMVREMERVSKKHVLIFIPNGYYYSHYIITKIRTFKMKNIIKFCNLSITNKGYADRPPWPAGVAVSSTSLSFSEGSKAKKREEEQELGVKDSFSISLIKNFFLLFTPAMANLEFLYPSPFREFLSHMFFIHLKK